VIRAERGSERVRDERIVVDDQNATSIAGD
jgi:hypothetical protein